MSDNPDPASDSLEGAPSTREKLARLQHDFIESWGELATIWGSQRSGGRLHSLLYINSDPLCAEEIGERLQISHGNTSTTVRQLVSAGVVRRTHRPGERRAYFTSEPDPWQWMRNTIRARREREVVPVFKAVRALLDEAQAMERKAALDMSPELRAELQTTREKISVFYAFLEQMLNLIDAFIAEPAVAPNRNTPPV